MDSKRISVLFVHWIGDQKRGATLREFGGSLHESVCQLFEPANVTCTDGVAGNGDAPAYADVTITHKGRELRVVAAESWWADTVSSPSYRSLLRWLFAAVPFVIQRALDAGARNSSAEIDRRRPRHHSPDPVRGVARRWFGLPCFALLCWGLVHC